MILCISSKVLQKKQTRRLILRLKVQRRCATTMSYRTYSLRTRKRGQRVAATALNECGVTEDALREKLESINGTMSLVELTPMILLPVQREF